MFWVSYHKDKKDHDCRFSSASIIKSIQDTSSASCAYCFFNSRDGQASLQSYDGLLRSITYQLCVCLDTFPDILITSYQNCGSGVVQPSQDVMQQICIAAVQNLAETFIIID